MGGLVRSWFERGAGIGEGRGTYFDYATDICCVLFLSEEGLRLLVLVLVVLFIGGALWWGEKKGGGWGKGWTGETRKQVEEEAYTMDHGSCGVFVSRRTLGRGCGCGRHSLGFGGV